MDEQWKDVVGYEGLYQVSNLGRIKCLPKTIHYGWYNNKVVEQREMIKKNTLDRNGYLFTILTKDGVRKNHLIHRLVAQSFLPNPNDYECVNHKDENKTNNYVDNLEWCSHKYNSNYGTIRQRISNATMGERNHNHKKVLCVETGIIYNGTGEAERETGIKSNHIRKCAIGKVKSNQELHWKYV